MEVVTGPVGIPTILRDRNNWGRYLAWRGDEVDAWTRRVVDRSLACRTPALGYHMYDCKACNIVRLIPHSCKTAFCSSCGKARTDAWCNELLSDLLDVEYRHLVFTLPSQLRHLIRVNKRVLLNALYRAASQTLLSLTAGKPRPLPGLNRSRMQRKRRKYTPGFMIVAHTFGSNLQFNPHLHILITAGGLSLDEKEWINAPPRSFLPAKDLRREWKKRVIKEIRTAEARKELIHPPFRKDPNNLTKVEPLLTHVNRKRWWIHIGKSLEEADHAVRYCCRYTRRPVIGEMRIRKYDGKDVHFLYTDYSDGERSKVMIRSALYFIHRLVQHIPPKNFIQVRHYGVFANARKGRALPIARKLLGQRKRRRPKPSTWETRRKDEGIPHPLACPKCQQPMTFFGTLFGPHDVLTIIAGVEPKARLPPECIVPRSRVLHHSRVG